MALPRVIVEVGFSGPIAGPGLVIGDSVRGIIGTAVVGIDGTWTDVSALVRSWQFRRGGSRGAGPNIRYEAGTCTIELNNADRRFDATNLAGPYVAAGASLVGPMVRVRIRAVWDDVTYPLWFGYADAWQVAYQPPLWSTVILTATDAFKVFTSHERGTSIAVGAGEDSGARTGRVLDSIDWPADDRDVATGDSTLQATNLSGNTLSELQLVADSELGEFYMDAAGYAVFRGRHSSLEDTRSNTSQAVFGDGPGELPYTDVTFDNDAENLANLITIGRVGGTEQIVEDAASRERYLTKTFQRTDLLLESDAETLQYAQAALFQAKDAEVRASQLVVGVPRPEVQGDVWPALLDRRFADRITVIRRPPGGGDPIERDVFVRGIEMSSDGDKWRTVFTPQSATRYAFLVIGNAELGVIGSNAIAY
jgi:hypothetical protein